MGNIINKIRCSEPWKKNIDRKYKFQSKNIDTINNSLENLFHSIRNIITKEIPELQQDYILEKINKFISDAGPHAKTLLQHTLLKSKKFIEKNNYMDDLSYELTWAILTSYTFIQSNDQWNKRKKYFEILINLWHKLFLDSFELNFYRLADKRYHSFTEHSKLAPDKVSFKYLPLKEGSDLCDGELVHYISLA